MKAAGKRGGVAGQRGSGAAGRVGSSGKAEERGARGAPFAHQELGTGNPLQAVPVEFVGSFPDPGVNLEPRLPEVAFIGRSNVGKSSLLNALVGRPGLARVSGTPGKTTLLNFYRTPSLYLVDLPGYGFARASQSARAGYRRLVDRYLTSRSTLAGVVWLLDIRRDPSTEDQAIHELLVESRRPVLPVFTKSDKLTRSSSESRARELAGFLGLETSEFLVTSSRSSRGVHELAASIIALGRNKP
ncbi:MAG TPA: ribosome biogenesis GTP-binding protein YihA/YsxC [Gemmatimonadales bacterium]|nr:ribosome biogenesis GTP-binding protein YihA/YsxC [Gemmatimonadales bacterium]